MRVEPKKYGTKEMYRAHARKIKALFEICLSENPNAYLAMDITFIQSLLYDPRKELTESQQKIYGEIQRGLVSKDLEIQRITRFISLYFIEFYTTKYPDRYKSYITSAYDALFNPDYVFRIGVGSPPRINEKIELLKYSAAKEVDISNFMISDYPGEFYRFLKALAKAPNVTKVNLSRMEISWEWEPNFSVGLELIAVLRSNLRIQDLDLSSCKLNEYSIMGRRDLFTCFCDYVARFRLRKLNLTDNPFEAWQIKNLYDAVINNLYLTDFKIDEALLSGIEKSDIKIILEKNAQFDFSQLVQLQQKFAGMLIDFDLRNREEDILEKMQSAISAMDDLDRIIPFLSSEFNKERGDKAKQTCNEYWALFSKFYVDFEAVLLREITHFQAEHQFQKLAEFLVGISAINTLFIPTRFRAFELICLHSDELPAAAAMAALPCLFDWDGHLIKFNSSQMKIINGLMFGAAGIQQLVGVLDSITSQQQALLMKLLFFKSIILNNSDSDLPKNDQFGLFAKERAVVFKDKLAKQDFMTSDIKTLENFIKFAPAIDQFWGETRNRIQDANLAEEQRTLFDSIDRVNPRQQLLDSIRTYRK